MQMKKYIILLVMSLKSVLARPQHIDDAVIRHYADRMNVSDSILHVPELYMAIHEWIGTPYRYGRSDKKGTDCSGFVRNIFLPLIGEELPRSASDMSRVINARPKADLKEGDLVFFNERGRTNSHVGIYLQKGWFVHASIYRGVTLNNLHTPYYTRLYSKGGSLKQGELRDIIIRTPTRPQSEETPALEPLFPIRLPYIDLPFSNFKPQTSNFKPQTSNLKPQTSNLK